MQDQKFELKVPKLIVRKVKRIEGNDEIETLEVFSPDKEKQICRIRTPINNEECMNDYPEVRRSSKRSRSKASSVSSADSMKARKRKKTNNRLSSDGEETDLSFSSSGKLL